MSQRGLISTGPFHPCNSYSHKMLKPHFPRDRCLVFWGSDRGRRFLICCGSWGSHSYSGRCPTFRFARFEWLLETAPALVWLRCLRRIVMTIHAPSLANADVEAFTEQYRPALCRRGEIFTRWRRLRFGGTSRKLRCVDLDMVAVAATMAPPKMCDPQQVGKRV